MLKLPKKNIKIHKKYVAKRNSLMYNKFVKYFKNSKEENANV